MKRLTLTLSATVLAVFATSASAQDWRVMLSDETVSKLPEPAVEIYKEAEVQNDRVNYDETVLLLAEAAERAPENIPLQFLVAARALDRAEIYYSASSYSQPPENMDYTSPQWRTAEPFYDMADNALQRLLVNPNLSAEARDRLENYLQDLEEGRSGIAQRDQARRDTAMPLVMKIRKAREEQMTGTTGDDYGILDTRNAFERDEEESDMAFADGALTTEVTLSPFRKLPGEYNAPFLPPPPAPQQQQGRMGVYGMGVDPFAADQQPPVPADRMPGGGDPFAGDLMGGMK